MAKKEDGPNVFHSYNIQCYTAFGQKLIILLPVRKIRVVTAVESSMGVIVSTQNKNRELHYGGELRNFLSTYTVHVAQINKNAYQHCVAPA